MPALLFLASAGAEPGLDPGTLERLGTAGIVAIVLLAVIGWLLRDRTKERADKDRIAAQRDDLFAQVIDTTATVTETLATVGPILEATNQELRLARERAR